MNDLLTIFIEAAHSNSIVPLASEATLYAMQAFGEKSLLFPVAAAIAGGIVGQTFNWWLGTKLMKLPSAPTDKPLYHTLKNAFNRYGFFLLFFAFAPLCNILVVAAGMFNTPLKRTLPLVVAGLIVHYGLLLV